MELLIALFLLAWSLGNIAERMAQDANTNQGGGS